MISHKIREHRRGRPPKMSKNIERLYKESKCSECSVVVTPMDFAKILGKFTKVKIKYESGTTVKKGVQQNTKSSINARLKNNENGMVLIPRKAYNQHPANLLKTSKSNEQASPQANSVKDKKPIANSSPRLYNILKENNRLKKSPVMKKPNILQRNEFKPKLKQYGLIFLNPVNKNKEKKVGNLSLKNLLPSINKNILPSDGWYVDYLPKDGEPKEDKVYDRIAAELEDLMNNEKPGEKSESGDNKDDFPSIMDILNDNTIASHPSSNQSSTIVQANLESSDVEAMLLGKTSDTSKETAPMEVDNSMTNLMDVVQINTNHDSNVQQQNSSDIMDNPNSPSILDETLQKGIEAHLPTDIVPQETLPIGENSRTESKKPADVSCNISNVEKITHIVFKKCANGFCSKSVTCPNNLKYSIEIEGKSVELLGAPKYISCLEDLQVLLQIVNETEISSVYVCH